MFSLQLNKLKIISILILIKVSFLIKCNYFMIVDSRKYYLLLRLVIYHTLKDLVIYVTNSKALHQPFSPSALSTFLVLF